MTTEPNVLLCLKDSAPGARGEMQSHEQLGLQNVSWPLAILLESWEQRGKKTVRTDGFQGEREQGIRDLTEATRLEWREPGEGCGRQWVAGRQPRLSWLPSHG